MVFYDGPLCAESRGRLRERSVRDGEVRMELAMDGGMLSVSCAAGAAADVVRAVASVMGGAPMAGYPMWMSGSDNVTICNRSNGETVREFTSQEQTVPWTRKKPQTKL